MKLLIIEDNDREVGLMFAYNDDEYALEQANIWFESGRIVEEINIPDRLFKNYDIEAFLYELLRPGR